MVQKRARKTGLVTVPDFLDGLPELPVGSGAPTQMEGHLDDDYQMVSYGYHTAAGSLGPPVLDCVVFTSAKKKVTGPSLGIAGRRSTEVIGWMTLGDGQEVRLPGNTQLYGVIDGVLTRSKMHITFPEFWHFLHTVEDRKSLRGLEEHIRLLREL